jgi:hypothetical protein
MLQYKAVEGQSLLDICLNTYGGLDLMSKLLQDNNIENINITPFSGQSFVWDETLTIDQAVNQTSQNSNIIYATEYLHNSPAMGVISGDGGSVVIPAPNPGEPGGPVVPQGLYPVFIGSLDYVSEASVKAMTQIMARKEDQEFIYNIDFKKPAFAYPTFYGQLSSIRDKNWFEIKSGFTKAFIDFTIDGQLVNYTINVLTYPTTQTDFKITYKF